MTGSDQNHKASDLQQSLARAQAALDATTDALISIDQNGIIEAINTATETLFGYTSEELIGANVSILMPEPHRSAHDTYIQRYLASGAAKVIGRGRELTGRKKDGTVFPMIITVGEAEAHGKHVFSALIHDISSRREIETSKDQFGQLIEQSLNEIYVFDAASLKFTHVNKGAESNLGYSQQELLSMTPIDIKPEFSTLRFRKLLEPILSGSENGIVLETQHRRKDGSTYDVEVHLRCLNKNQSPRLVSAIVLDTSDKKSALTRLQKEHDFNTTLLNTTDVLIVAADRDFRLTRFNRAAENLTGYAEKEVLGRKPADFLIPKEDIDDHESRASSVEEDQKGKGANIRWECKDGSIKDIMWWYGTLPQNEDGNPFIVATGIDVTEQRALQARLQQTQKMEVLGQLTGGVAHDFNNLLAAIMGSLEIAEGDVPEDSTAKEFLKDALDAAELAADLTRRLLAFSRRQPLKPERVNLNAALRDIQNLIRRTLGGNIAIEFRLKPRIGDSFIDPIQFESTILNLAVNARDSMEHGGRLSIETDHVRFEESDLRLFEDFEAGEYIRVRVSDTGMGMSPDVIEHAFEPFFTTKAPERGTGLGLSMAYGFVKQSGGQINIYSELKKGTVVTLYFPVSEPNDSDLSNEVLATKTTSGDETILLVDDDDRVRRVAKHQLESLGYAVLEAASAEDALTIMHAEADIDLLFTDVIMPDGKSGPELVEQATRSGFQGKVLYTSGFTEDAISSAHLRTGKVPLIQKPYSRQALAQAIRQALNTDTS